MQKLYGWYPNGLWGTDPLYMLDGSGTYFYHNDHLGTPQRLTDATTGAVVWSAGYAAFGAATIDPLSTVENNLRFPGQYFDAETGLHYNWHRTYDPVTGRYTQVDPIGFAGGDLNVYRYVLGNPLGLQDYTGLIVWGVGGAGSFGALGVGDGYVGAAWDNNSEGAATVTVASISGGLQAAAGLGGSVVIAPFADSVHDLQGVTFDLQLRLLVNLTISIPADINLKNIVFALDSPGLNLGVGIGTSYTDVQRREGQVGKCH
jgi:RHS repeat-associated protein